MSTNSKVQPLHKTMKAGPAFHFGGLDHIRRIVGHETHKVKALTIPEVSFSTVEVGRGFHSKSWLMK